MHRSSGRATPAFSLALFMLMLGCILWLTALGAGLYGSLEASRTANEQTRAALGSLVARVRSDDAAGAVRLDSGPEGDMLVLTEQESGYEFRIYLADGWLMEQFCAADAATDPEAAQPLAPAQEFTAQWASPALLRLTVDGNTADAALRSAGGGAA